MKILSLSKLLSFLFLLSLVIVSCSKDPVTEEEVVPGKVDPTEEVGQNSLFTRSITSDEGLNLDCIDILYPFDVVDINGDIHTISNEEDFIALLDPGSDFFIIDFIYPLDIVDEDGTESTIADAEELSEAFANCLPNGWDSQEFPAYLINSDNSCWNLQYPVSVIDLEGNTSTYDDEESFVAALAEEPLFFVFPITLVNEEGETVVANNVEELLTTLFDCNGLDVDTTIWNGGSDFDYIGCYELTFPFSVILTDGTTVVVNNHMEYCDLLLEGSIQDFAFPMTLIGEDGEEIVVNSQEELEALLEDCWGGPGETVGDLQALYLGAVGQEDIGIDPCFEIMFPMNAQELDWDGNILNEVTLNNMDELEEISSELYNIVYPVSVTIISTEELVEIQDYEELLDVIGNCL